MDRHAADVIADQLTLAGVHADADLDPEFARRAGYRQRTSQRARRWAVEGRQEAIADSLDLAPGEARELLAHALVVARQQVAPAAVAELGGSCRRIHDVGEHDRQQRP